ncbi:hypothetical protein MSAN_00132600 [Mycena sanguinolenta]|uniref:Uncharacterized protein n=1 Tax=Mycena sanguinolenta TaxID=230812 RepID=A0A8H6ZKG3_9AGAR|nr:hypothetical protein MSAN_00132600 [Mycena sanguinolenta]
MQVASLELHALLMQRSNAITLASPRVTTRCIHSHRFADEERHSPGLCGAYCGAPQRLHPDCVPARSQVHLSLLPTLVAVDVAQRRPDFTQATPVRETFLLVPSRAGACRCLHGGEKEGCGAARGVEWSRKNAARAWTLLSESHARDRPLTPRSTVEPNSLPAPQACSASQRATGVLGGSCDRFRIPLRVGRRTSGPGRATAWERYTQAHQCA